MAKKYYYAVKKGKVAGVYFNWEDCKKQVTGFSGAIYKKFDTIEDAKNFVEDIDSGYTNKKENMKGSKKSSVEKVVSPKANEVVAYVDGSYNIATKECGYGAVLFFGNKKEIFSKKVDIKEYSDFRNITGEVFGSLFAIEKAIEYGASKVHIYFDYKGIREWALGNWKRNNDLTKFYKSRYDILTKDITVVFNKVAAHTGDVYNEEADLLAKKSIGV